MKKKNNTILNELIINNEIYFKTSSNRIYKKISFPKEIENSLFLKMFSILLLSSYYYQNCCYEELLRIYKGYRIDKKGVELFLFGEPKGNKKTKLTSKYIHQPKDKVNIRGCFIGLYCLTNGVKAALNRKEFSFIQELIERDIEEREQYIDAYQLAMKQHSSIKHFLAIYYLHSKALKENISIKYKHNETSIVVEEIKDYFYTNHKRIEFDLICRYNNKQVGIEVETGTTSNSDMFKKIIKHHSLAYKQGIYKDIIIACNNKEALEKTRDKIDKAIERYYQEEANNFFCAFQVNYYYLNLSELNNKSLRSFLNEAINKKLHRW